MVTGKQKVTRKQLLREPDEFITFTGRVIQYVREHERGVYIAGIVVLSVVILLAAGKYYLVRTEKNAFAAYDAVQSRYAMGQMTGETEKGLTTVKSDLKKVLNDYPRTAAAKLASVTYGRVAAQNKDWDEAIKRYKRGMVDFSADPMVVNMIENDLAYAYEGKQDLATAAQYFERVTAVKDSPFRQDALLGLGRVYGLLKDTQKSKKAYETLLSDYKDSNFAPMAKEKLAQLSG